MAKSQSFQPPVCKGLCLAQAVICAVVGVLLIPVTPCHAFGPTGHRVVGQIGANHLSQQAKRATQEILGTETFAQAATWPDEIRSDPELHRGSWHFVTIEDGETYKPSNPDPLKGDAVQAIEFNEAVLKNPRATREDKVIALRWLIHLVGDVHQPLHVGRGADRGGNTIDVMWFDKVTNLHVVWDEGLIEATKLSFSELASFIDTETPETIARWQDSTVLDWVEESVGYRSRVYEKPEMPRYPGDASGSYKYIYKNDPLVKQRMVQAGVRLAGMLNKIFSEDTNGASAPHRARSTSGIAGTDAAVLPLRAEAPAPSNSENSARFAVQDRASSRLQTVAFQGAAGLAPSATQNLAEATLAGTLWAQQGLESRAMLISAYHQAQDMLDQALADKTWTAVPESEPRTPQEAEALAALPPAIILDADETVLDNSPFQAWLIKKNETYSPASWNRWVASAEAKALPGSVEFIDHARKRGVAIFYVTNRTYKGDLDANGDGVIDPNEKDVILKPYTIKNLRAVGLLPQEGLSDGESLLLKGEKPDWGEDKTTRRKLLAKNYRIVLLLGDSIGDFIGYDFQTDYGSYYDLDETTRLQELRKHQHRWGKSWIVLPNAMYGGWLPRTHQERLNALNAWDGTLSAEVAAER